jgi:hypothetical protein
LVLALLVVVALISLCLGTIYRVCCAKRRKSKWTVEHGPHANPAYDHSKDDQKGASVGPYVNNSSQTLDAPIRI